MYISLINKYKPNNIDNININEFTKDIINIYLNNNKLLFLIYGNQGTGKSTLINLLLKYYYNFNKKEIEDNTIFINLLKEQGINYYRNDLKNFCQINNIEKNNKKKTIIFDDLDLLNEQSQIIFASYMNKYKNINFIISCTDIQKIQTSIIDKLEHIKLEPVSNKYLYKIADEIIKGEKINIEKDFIDKLIKSSNYSISSMIYNIEKIILLDLHDEEKLNIIINSILLSDLDMYINYCKNKNYNDALEILDKYCNKGYSVIDILDNLFLYIKNYSNLCEESKYKIIKHICKYINIFHNIHENTIELFFLTTNIINSI